MDILAEDLEITRLFGERLRTARENNTELEKVWFTINAWGRCDDGADRQ